MDVDLAQALLAGWLAGAVAGLATTATVLVMLARRPVLATRLPFQHRLSVLGIVFANALTLALTLVGLVLGALHHRLDGGPRFALLVVGVLAAVAVPYTIVRGVRSGEAPVVLGGLALAGVAFGVALPWLARVGS